MKVKWTGLVDELRGRVDSRHYARHIPGNGTEEAVCQKPELSKKTKKKKAAHPTCKSFGNYIAESKAILHDPERRAVWQAKYDETLLRAKKWGKPAYGRFRVMRGCSEWYMQPLSTLSVSIEHPLGQGGDLVEKC